MLTELRRRLTTRPWTWIVAAVVAVLVVAIGLTWLDGIDVRTDSRQKWAERIVLLAGVGVLAVELARRLRVWLGAVALVGLVVFLVGGLGAVVDEVRMESYSDSQRRPLAAAAPIVATVEPAAPAAGIADREAWNSLELTTETLFSGLIQPMSVTAVPGTDDYIIAQREGPIVRMTEGDDRVVTLVDLADETTLEGERGVLDATLSPVDGRLYVSFTDRQGDNRVSSWALDGDTLSDRREIIEITQPFDRHNGGGIDFDADGYLLLGVGDGGRSYDFSRAGQDRSNRLATVVRIAPLPTGGYEIPPDNPYLDVAGAWPEIYAYGLRNPFRLSADEATGDIWIGDVGQNMWEEVDRIPYGNPGGSNFGWGVTEGREVTVGRPDEPTGYTEADIPADWDPPYYTYQQDLSQPEGTRNNITGGRVYRGSAIPVLDGTYVFADFAQGWVRGLLVDGDAAEPAGERDLLEGVPVAVSFDLDHDGELIVVSLGGDILRIVEG